MERRTQALGQRQHPLPHRHPRNRLRQALTPTSDGGVADANKKPRIAAGLSCSELFAMVTTLAATTFRNRFSGLGNRYHPCCRHGPSAHTSWRFGHRGFGGDHQAGDRGRILQCSTADVGRAQDAHGDHVAVLAGAMPDYPSTTRTRCTCPSSTSGTRAVFLSWMPAAAVVPSSSTRIRPRWTLAGFSTLMS